MSFKVHSEHRLTHVFRIQRPDNVQSSDFENQQCRVVHVTVHSEYSITHCCLIQCPGYYIRPQHAQRLPNCSVYSETEMLWMTSAHFHDPLTHWTPVFTSSVFTLCVTFLATPIFQTVWAVDFRYQIFQFPSRRPNGTVVGSASFSRTLASIENVSLSEPAPSFRFSSSCGTVNKRFNHAHYTPL
jgi:hypothetical protein